MSNAHSAGPQGQQPYGPQGQHGYGHQQPPAGPQGPAPYGQAPYGQAPYGWNGQPLDPQQAAAIPRAGERASELVEAAAIHALLLDQGRPGGGRASACRRIARGSRQRSRHAKRHPGQSARFETAQAR